MVCEKHSQRYPEEARNVGSIRRRFASLYRTRIPTGDPHCPDEVRRAKHLQFILKDKAEIITGEETFDIEDNSIVTDKATKESENSNNNFNENGNDSDNTSSAPEYQCPNVNQKAPPLMVTVSPASYAAGSTSTSTPTCNTPKQVQKKRGCNDISELVKLQQLYMEEDRQRRKEEAQERREMFQMAMTTFQAIFTGNNFNQTKKRKERDDDSSESK